MMDDQGNEIDYSDPNQMWELTPKGFLSACLMNSHGLSKDSADEAWHLLEAFCVRGAKEKFPDAGYASLVFDGVGGTIIGIDKGEENHE